MFHSETPTDCPAQKFIGYHKVRYFLRARSNYFEEHIRISEVTSLADRFIILNDVVMRFQKKSRNIIPHIEYIDGLQKLLHSGSF